MAFVPAVLDAIPAWVSTAFTVGSGVVGAVGAVQDANATAAAAEYNAKQSEADALVADQNRKSAMQTAALAQTDVFSKRFVYYFASFWSLCAALYIACITFGTIPAANIRFADTILGFLLGTVVATIFNFFYGTSKSSQDKTDKSAEMMKAGA